MSALRIGVVGAGFAAELHATNYRPLRGAKVELTAVSARTEDFVDAIRERRAPLSGADMAREVWEAASGRRVGLRRA
jgi:predicted dehydrogenase